MNFNKLQYDSDFEHAIYFAYYVMVVSDEEMIGGGLIESYDGNNVWINGKRYVRSQSSFIHTPPPEVQMIYPTN
jgi:hypothetical protein